MNSRRKEVTIVRSMRKSMARKGFTLIELMIVIAIIGVLAAIAVPNFRAARERANTRACYANQKTIAGALEMYNLDNNTKIATLDKGVGEKLKTGGYLQSLVDDPGQGQDTFGDYIFVNAGNGIECNVHGPIQDDAGGGS